MSDFSDDSDASDGYDDWGTGNPMSPSSEARKEGATRPPRLLSELRVKEWAGCIASPGHRTKTRGKMLLLAAEDDESIGKVSKISRKQSLRNVDLVCARDPSCLRSLKAKLVHNDTFESTMWHCVQGDPHTSCVAGDTKSRSRKCAYSKRQLATIVSPMFGPDQDVKPRDVVLELPISMSMLNRLKHRAFKDRYGMSIENWKRRPEKMLAFAMGLHPRLWGGVEKRRQVQAKAEAVGKMKKSA